MCHNRSCCKIRDRFLENEKSGILTTEKPLRDNIFLVRGLYNKKTSKYLSWPSYAHRGHNEATKTNEAIKDPLFVEGQ